MGTIVQALNAIFVVRLFRSDVDADSYVAVNDGTNNVAADSGTSMRNVGKNKVGDSNVP